MNKTVELAYWIGERYAMKLRRDLGGAPRWKHGWSDDPHMGSVRYCNVHREDDKVTRWLAEYWRPKYHVVWQIVLARMVNYIPTLQQILLCDSASKFEQFPSLDVVKDVMKTLRSRRDKIWTSAYTISTCGRPMDKIDYVIDHVVKNVQSAFGEGKPLATTLGTAYRQLITVDGLGSFLAGQVLADLKNTKGHPLSKAPDFHSWCCPGPGSIKGLSEYFGKNITSTMFYGAINECYSEVKPHIDFDTIPPIHMQDFQNCLCEFSKYMRVRTGGHVRNRYP